MGDRLANPYWDYSRNKIACEERLTRAYREEGFPAVIVRPSLTYGDTSTYGNSPNAAYWLDAICSRNQAA